ncbi:MAG: hypothetical protein QOF45_1172 [Gaiellaceae bacterium]|nr:hypothetical protein [Gaiellaceae bacterium]
MPEPDFVLSPKDGEPSRVTVVPRAKPWLVRFGTYDLYVVIAPGSTTEPPVGPERTKKKEKKKEDPVRPELRL